MPEPTAAVLDPALSPPPWTARWPVWSWLLAFVAGTVALRAAALLFTERPGGLAVIWPATGLAVFALLVSRRRTWPLVVGLAFVVGILDALRIGRSPAQALAFNVANGSGALVTAWLVVRIGGRPTLRTLRGALALALAPVLGVGAVSVVAHLVLTAANASFAEHRFWIFWAGTSLGSLLITSLLVEWAEPAPPAGVKVAAVLSVAGIVATLAAALLLMQSPAFPITGDVVLLPPLLWAAVRFGARGATTALAAGSAALLALASGEGLTEPIATQLLVAVGGVSILAVAAVGEERRAAEWRRILLERAMDHFPDPAGIVAEDGRVVWANEAAARSVGLGREEILGRDAWAVAGGTAGRWREFWERTRAAGVPRLPPRRPAEIAAGEISATVVDVGGARLMVAAIHDHSDRRRAEEASRLAALGTLAAGVAHEINNPLSYVVSNLAHAKERLGRLPDRDGTLRLDVLEPLAEAEDGARRVRDIVRQLGAFARAEEAAGPVDPRRALRSVLAMAANEVRHRARLATELAPTPAVIASEAQLTEVFLDLIINAAQAIPDGSAEQHEIRVKLFARGNEVIVEFSDTGHGMSADTRSRIFEPFFTTRVQGGGVGLGLAISHSIVTRLGGRIDVESTPGQGSVFRVVLPAASGVQAPPAPAYAPTPPPASRPRAAPAEVAANPTAPSSPAAPPAASADSDVAAPRLRILVVDDEPLVSRALARLLGTKHDVVTAADGREALVKIRAGERFDAVLCDLMMPELSGMDLHAAVAVLDPGLARRFVFMTGGAFTEASREFLARTQNPSIEKPVDRVALQAALRAVG